LGKILKEKDFKTSEMVYAGDDVVDSRAAGLSVFPTDVFEEVKKYIGYVSTLSSGKGVVM
jgi:3-deoxy-D-manno-octulosonate 8-phosphate phosphatase KdsC-like HAD superfamily phosphatase